MKVELLNADKVWYYGHPEVRNYGSLRSSINSDGKIIKTGDYSLVKEIEKNGFKDINVKKVTSIGTCAIKEITKNE